MMDALLLARIQFAANITFHILFPSINIALAWFLLFFKWQYTKTRDEEWMDAYKLWVKVFALCFAMGVVSGITMSFQFGTNWPGFMEKVGNIAGPLLAYEVLTAFFLEATFLGIMLYGYTRVSNALHTFATILVAVGTMISAFWILVLNSWMHTPAGFKMVGGKAVATNWLEIIFNPSLPYRMLHMFLASGLTAAFLIAGLSAYRYIRTKSQGIALVGIKAGIYTAAILIPFQILIGDLHGLNTREYQPAKIAAMEAIWETEKGVGLRLFALPDEKNQTNHYEVIIPHLASIILTHSFNGEIKGLKSFDGKHPPVTPIFFTFRIMVGVGILMLMVSWFCAWYLYRKRDLPDWLAYILVAMTFSGSVATVAGWYTTEIGRQPWLVKDVLLTVDAVAQKVTSPMLVSTLGMYLSIYTVLIISFISVIFYLARKATEGVELAAKSTSGRK